MRFQAVIGSLALVAWLAGCEDPCDNALKKAQKCWKIKNPKKEPNNADPPIFLQVCKAEQKKFSKCLKIKDCDEYAKCISQAAADPRAIELLKQAATESDMAPAEPAPADMPAEPAPADMPAPPAPADMPAEPAPADMPAPPAPADMPAAPSMQ